MKELDLLKIMMHKLATIESKMIKHDDLEEMNEQLYEQEESLKNIQNNLKDLKLNMEIKHIENMNSDDVLLRSILDKYSLQYK
ncbi:hypothetical protein CR194_14320 [Salipaludibacillus keqinensis]|uniref:Uncharacterized protein n=1 Tax=Salipaludibacillus keqinensis TaxID=2045207 RepID=A0A323TCM9_9BACI|nr:hypothetical protein [Salipaludibacillus keqinensis]PYZ92821.1 hypothetical protein CR194_14320 [Salipaludibacillus keqinensis]